MLESEVETLLIGAAGRVLPLLCGAACRRATPAEAGAPGAGPAAGGAARGSLPGPVPAVGCGPRRWLSKSGGWGTAVCAAAAVPLAGAPCSSSRALSGSSTLEAGRSP